MPIGFMLPYTVSSGSVGYFEMTRDELSAVASNIKSLLVTNWGERPMHRDMGCNLIEFIFEPQRSDELRSMIADRIMSQLSRWLPFVSIKTLNVMLSGDSPSVPENSISVFIQFSLNGRQDTASVGVTYVA